MKKMPCLFVREFHGCSSFTITRTVTSGCEWVIAGEGVPTIKRDGTACAVIGGVLHARYDAKAGKAPPANGVPCDPAPDAVTGHWPHWVPVGDEPHFKWHREALARAGEMNDGTYELCGPQLQANAENLATHRFFRHGREEIRGLERSFDGLAAWLRDNDCEGIVFHHGDGRVCKIRRADFGLAWPMRRVVA